MENTDNIANFQTPEKANNEVKASIFQKSKLIQLQNHCLITGTMMARDIDAEGRRHLEDSTQEFVKALLLTDLKGRALSMYNLGFANSYALGTTSLINVFRSEVGVHELEIGNTESGLSFFEDVDFNLVNTELIEALITCRRYIPQSNHERYKQLLQKARESQNLDKSSEKEKYIDKIQKAIDTENSLEQSQEELLINDSEPDIGKETKRLMREGKSLNDLVETAQKISREKLQVSTNSEYLNLLYLFAVSGRADLCTKYLGWFEADIKRRRELEPNYTTEALSEVMRHNVLEAYSIIITGVSDQKLSSTEIETLRQNPDLLEEAVTLIPEVFSLVGA